MKKCVIFDVDGTINQTAIYALPAYRKALGERGREISDSEIISCIGLSPAMIIEKLFGSLEGAKLEKWRQDIRDYEFMFMDEEAAAFPRMEETMRKLQAADYELAICSNAFPEHIKHVLHAIHLEKYFTLIGSLELGTTKEEVLQNLLIKADCEQACMVGDRKFDVQAARHCSIPVIGCAYGYAPEEIRDADQIVSSAVEIYEAVEVLLGD